MGGGGGGGGAADKIILRLHRWQHAACLLECSVPYKAAYIIYIYIYISIYAMPRAVFSHIH